jgi:hypothetical protein
MFGDLNIAAEKSQVGDNLWQQVIAVAEMLIDLCELQRNRLSLVPRQIDVADRVPLVPYRANIAAGVDDCLHKRGNV